MAGVFIQQHDSALWLIRQSCASYRELILRNYVYMRDQHKRSFWSDKISKKVSFNFSSLLAKQMATAPTPGTRGSGGSRSTEAPACDVCDRTHSGRPCPLRGFPTRLQKKLGQGLRQRKYELALKCLKKLIAEHPDESKDSLIEKARAEAEA